MVKKETITDIQYVGRLSLTGKTHKTKKGKTILVEPKAEANLNFESPWKYNPVPAIGETIFAVPCGYREATTEKDVAYFKATLFDENENIIGEAKANSKERYAIYDYFGQTLQLKENFEKYRGNLPIKLKRKILIECFLKKKKWKKESGWEILTRDSKVLELEINLQKPERPTWPAPTVKVAIDGHYITEQDCGEKCTCIKYATEYDIYAGVLNNGKSDIISGEFRLKGWPLEKTSQWFAANPDKLPLKPSKYDILIKDVFRYKYGERGDWYAQTDIFGHLGLNSEKSGARLNYDFDYEFRDASGYLYNGSQDVCIDVVIPQYKFDAMEIYNQTTTVELVGITISFALVFGGLGILIKNLIAALAILGINISISVGEILDAEDIKSWARRIMDDPPKLLKKYLPIKALSRKARIKTILETTWQNLANIESNIYSAKFKKDYTHYKSFLSAKYDNKKRLIKTLNTISKMVQKSADKIKTVKHKLSAKEVELLKKYLESKDGRAIIKKQFSAFGMPTNKLNKSLLVLPYLTGKLDLYKNLIGLARSFKNLSNSLRRF